jgi:hypothetical protein
MVKFINESRLDGGEYMIKYFEYEQISCMNNRVKSKRIEEDVGVYVDETEYNSLKIAFTSCNNDAVKNHSLFSPFLSHVWKGNRLKFCLENRKDPKYYTYRGHMTDTHVDKKEFCIYEVGLNYKREKGSINFVVKVSKRSPNNNTAVFYEQVLKKHKVEEYQMNIHIKPLPVLDNRNAEFNNIAEAIGNFRTRNFLNPLSIKYRSLTYRRRVKKSKIDYYNIWVHKKNIIPDSLRRK